MARKIADIAYPSGTYQQNGQEKTSWTNIAEMYETERDGKKSYYLKFDTLALNPTIVIQLTRQKKETGRDVLLRAFAPRDRETTSPSNAPAGGGDDNPFND